MGVNVGMFVAGGLLQGVGQGIEKKAEMERQNALMQYQANREFALKQFEVEAHHIDTQTSADASLKGQQARGAATIEAAHLSSDAQRDDTKERETHEDTRNTARVGAQRDDTTARETAENDRNNARITAGQSGAKYDPVKAMTETQQIAHDIMTTDNDLDKRARAAKRPRGEQAYTEAAALVAKARKDFNVGPKSGAMPGLTSAPPDSNDDAAAAAAAPAQAAPAPSAPAPAAPAPVAPAVPAPAPAAPGPAQLPLPKPIPLPSDKTQLKAGQTYTATDPRSGKPTTLIYTLDPQGKPTMLPAPMGAMNGG